MGGIRKGSRVSILVKLFGEKWAQEHFGATWETERVQGCVNAVTRNGVLVLWDGDTKPMWTRNRDHLQFVPSVPGPGTRAAAAAGKNVGAPAHTLPAPAQMQKESSSPQGGASWGDDHRGGEKDLGSDGFVLGGVVLRYHSGFGTGHHVSSAQCESVWPASTSVGTWAERRLIRAQVVASSRRVACVKPEVTHANTTRSRKRSKFFEKRSGKRMKKNAVAKGTEKARLALSRATRKSALLKKKREAHLASVKMVAKRKAASDGYWCTHPGCMRFFQYKKRLRRHKKKGKHSGGVVYFRDSKTAVHRDTNRSVSHEIFECVVLAARNVCV